MQKSTVCTSPLLPGATFLLALRNKTLLRKAILIAIFCAMAGMSTYAQDVPRFEIGGSFNAQQNSGLGIMGPGFRGVFNLGRFVSLESELNWFPRVATDGRIGTGIEALFGAKVGYRTQHFGFFGKVRPGFVTFSDTLRQDTFDFATFSGVVIPRFDRLTEPVVDFGEVIEYYPSKHWALRWDVGDRVVFQEGIRFNFVNTGNQTVFPFPNDNRTANNFQFSTGVQYRF